MKRTDFSEANSKTKHPAKVVVAIVKDKDGKFNPITLEWYMKTSIKPPMFAISIGHTRYSHECLQQNRFFNLCFPSNQMIEAVKLWGSKSGRDLDKLEVGGHEWFAGRLDKYPIIKDAKATFECKVVTQVKSGDHTIFVGEVKLSWLDEEKEVITVKDLM
ncbi:MAG: flavin reductase family protein [Candidatus Cloacimonetes bacterium]|nr:flavin reductase family protein [Candidatus Cloacimonadota bacterium]MCF7813735.1 flavin reductase family protein [Candidatus Cloacimonadota bacterium]MCF7867801.1 flavin reductase family protein [Candidatus Cloacimonadota bacterium]MCF7883221.1 flavin reductase family protein [Candidatus Cloacimonadota bacterium]